MTHATLQLKNILSALVLIFTISLNAQVASVSPTVAEVFKVGYAAYQQGNYPLAIKNFDQAAKIDNSKSYVFYHRGLCQKAIGNNAAAIQDFNISNNLKPTAEAFYQIGLISYEKADMVNALAQFEKAKEIKADVERMNFIMGMIYYTQNRYDLALECFYAYSERVKNYADAYYYRGLSEAKLGQYGDAVKSFKFAMIYKDSDWKLYYKMYEMYLAMNDKTNALYSLSMVIELGQRQADFYQERARLNLDLGNTFKYEEDMASAKALNASLASN